MKILITGGHITPALSLLPLLARDELLFIIRKHAYEGDTNPSYEYQTISDLGFSFKTITTGRLQRHFTLHTIPSLLKIPLGFIQSLAIVSSYKPEVVLSFGGYVALPVCLAANFLGVPIVTHEQTVKVGLTNRIISKIARKICVAFSASLDFFPTAKTVVVGNPLRMELFDPPKNAPFQFPQGKDLPILYITGGSGGSHSINELVFNILGKLLTKYNVIHQTGSISLFNDYEKLVAKRKKLSGELAKRYILRKHLNVNELAWIYKNTDMLIGRSGANTIYEILTFGIPSLLIPLAVAGNAEQVANARLAEKSGLGKILPQEKLTGEKLLAVINSMIQDLDKYKNQATAAAKLVIPDANARIIVVLKDVVGKI